MSESLESIPLQDRARAAEKLARELIAKIETEYLPKVRTLQRAVDPESERPAGDLSVREGVRNVFGADASLDETWQQVRLHLESISKDLKSIAHLE